MPIRSLIREPLLHFLLLGGLLFLLPGGQEPTADETIVVPSGRIEQLATTFARTWQRPPTQAEMQGLIDDYVKEEVYVREALRLELDRDDTIIRRRLRQKMEFLSEDAGALEAPGVAELGDYLESHAEKYVFDPEIEFVQIYLNPDRRGESIEAQAEALLRKLRSNETTFDLETLGDSLLLPTEVPLKRQREVERLFGRGFSESIFTLPIGAWNGPLESGYGLHLVRVSGKVESRVPELSEVRKAVERDFLLDQRTERSDALYARLSEPYRIEIQWPEVAEGTGQGDEER